MHRRRLSGLLLGIGMAGLAVVLSLNLYTALNAQSLNGLPWYSSEWWTRWFPAYTIWVSLIAVALLLRFLPSRHARKRAEQPE